MSKQVKVSKVTFVEYRDASGKVLAKTTQGKGRRNAQAFDENGVVVIPNCSLKAAEGLKAKEVAGVTVHVPTTVVAREPSFYVVKDADGHEISRVQKGRGRVKVGFVQEGQDWVKVETAPVHA